MAGYTDLPFRRLAFEHGAALAATEMVSVRGLIYNNAKTKDLMATHSIENPTCVQLFGNNPNDFLIAAKEGMLEKFDIVDINMGCPMPKITTNGDGSALIANIKTAAAIVETLAKCDITVTVKTRLGISNSDTKNTIEFCTALQQAGAYAIVLHGRSAKQLYTGAADWQKIGEVADKIKIPVFGNGDVFADNALELLKNCNIAGLMIGRGALANPDIFNRIIAKDIKSTNKNSNIATHNIIDIILKHIEYSKECFDSEKFIVHKLRKHFAYYLKNIKTSRQTKVTLLTAESLELIENVVKTEFTNIN